MNLERSAPRVWVDLIAPVVIPRTMATTVIKVSIRICIESRYEPASPMQITSAMLFRWLVMDARHFSSTSIDYFHLLQIAPRRSPFCSCWIVPITWERTI